MNSSIIFGLASVVVSLAFIALIVFEITEIGLGKKLSHAYDKAIKPYNKGISAAFIAGTAINLIVFEPTTPFPIVVLILGICVAGAFMPYLKERVTKNDKITNTPPEMLAALVFMAVIPMAYGFAMVKASDGIFPAILSPLMMILVVILAIMRFRIQKSDDSQNH